MTRFLWWVVDTSGPMQVEQLRVLLGTTQERDYRPRVGSLKRTGTIATTAGKREPLASAGARDGQR